MLYFCVRHWCDFNLFALWVHWQGTQTQLAHLGADSAAHLNLCICAAEWSSEVLVWWRRQCAQAEVRLQARHACALCINLWEGESKELHECSCRKKENNIKVLCVCIHFCWTSMLHKKIISHTFSLGCGCPWGLLTCVSKLHGRPVAKHPWFSGADNNTLAAVTCTAAWLHHGREAEGWVHSGICHVLQHAANVLVVWGDGVALATQSIPASGADLCISLGFTSSVRYMWTFYLGSCMLCKLVISEGSQQNNKELSISEDGWQAASPHVHHICLPDTDCFVLSSQSRFMYCSLHSVLPNVVNPIKASSFFVSC